MSLLGDEPVAQALEFPAEFGVIVDFPVEHEDSVAVLGRHRLAAGFEVDDFQAGRAQRDELGAIHALLVWPTMNEGIYRDVNTVGTGIE